MYLQAEESSSEEEDSDESEDDEVCFWPTESQRSWEYINNENSVPAKLSKGMLVLVVVLLGTRSFNVHLCLFPPHQQQERLDSISLRKGF